MKLTPDEQIDAIVRLMVTGEWKGAASCRKLAVEWVCHPRTVGDRAVSASAVVHRVGTPLEEWITAKLAELEQVKEVAMRLKRPVVVSQGGEMGSVVELYPAPDVKAAALAIKLQLEARGVFAHARKGPGLPADEFDKLSAAERVAKLREALAEEEAELAKAGGNGVH